MRIVVLPNGATQRGCQSALHLEGQRHTASPKCSAMAPIVGFVNFRHQTRKFRNFGKVGRAESALFLVADFRQPSDGWCTLGADIECSCHVVLLFSSTSSRLNWRLGLVDQDRLHRAAAIKRRRTDLRLAGRRPERLATREKN
jgi:hypothetical protein